MKSKIAFAAVALTSLTVFPAFAAEAQSAKPATLQTPIHFGDLNGVTSWRPDTDTTLFIQSKAGQWHKVELLEPCMKYDASKGIRFITELEPDTNQKVSKVIVERRICTVTSLVPVEKPAGTK